MSYQSERIEEIVVGLYDRGAIRFSNFEFVLKSDRRSPLFFNQRPITSFDTTIEMPIKQQSRLRDNVIDAYAEGVETLGKLYDHLYGIPQALTPLTAIIADRRGDSLLWGRVGKKDYGIHAELEGSYSEGQSVVALDDVITTAGSKFETASALEEAGLTTAGFVVMFDREEGGAESVRQAGHDLIAITGLANSMAILRDAGRIGQQEFDWIAQYHEGLRADGLL